MVRTIRWVEYVNPLTPIDQLGGEEEFDRLSSHDVLTYEDPEPEYRPPPRGVWNGPALAGPMGLIPIGGHNDPGQNFKLWVGHTNFHVTPKVVAAIKGVPGVEVFRVWTPYRFWLGVGMLFRSHDVQQNVERAVCPRSPTEVSLAALRKSLGRHPYWAIVVRQDGKVQCLTGQTESDVSGKVAPFRGTARQVHLSWEDARARVTRDL